MACLREDDVVDLVICFKCGGVNVYSKYGKNVATTNSPLNIWRRIYKKHGLEPLE